MLAKTGAERQRANRNRIQNPGCARGYSALNSPTHRLGARCGECTHVDEQSIGKRGKLFRFLGFDHHCRGSAQREQHIGGEGLHDIVGHTVRERGTGSELM